jgi:hypothetical protein
MPLPILKPASSLIVKPNAVFVAGAEQLLATSERFGQIARPATTAPTTPIDPAATSTPSPLPATAATLGQTATEYFQRYGVVAGGVIIGLIVTGLVLRRLLKKKK